MGTGTSQPGNFNQAEWTWDDNTFDVVQWAFEYNVCAVPVPLRFRFRTGTISHVADMLGAYRAQDELSGESPVSSL